MREIASEEVALWIPLCNKLAWKLSGIWRAEWDDLRQEGLIAVWLSLRDGYQPTEKHVKNRMKNWLGVCRRRGFTED